MTMKTSGSRAFTLIELLVAASLTVILAGLMIGVSRQLLESWTRNSGIFSAQAQGRLVLDQLTLDLQSALCRDDGRVWLTATVQTDPSGSGLWESALRQKPADSSGGSLRLDAAELRECRHGVAGTWLRFFTVAPVGENASLAGEPADIPSAPAAVSYQIIRHRVGANPAAEVKYLFYRAVVRAAQNGTRPGTLETGFNLDPAVNESGYSKSDLLNDGTRLGDPFSVTHPDHPEAVFAENVVDFGLRFYRRDPSGGLVRIFPVDANDTFHLAKAPASSLDASVAFPEVVDVMVRVLTDEGARLIAAFESSAGRLGARPAQYLNDAEWWWGLVESKSEVFIRRIVLPASSS